MSLDYLSNAWEGSPCTGEKLLIHLALANTYSGGQGAATVAYVAKMARLHNDDAHALLQEMHEDRIIHIYMGPIEPIERDGTFFFTLDMYSLFLNDPSNESEPTRSSAKQRQRPPTPPKPGYVYVVRCGEHYKIGMTADPLRRMPQLALQLPHPPELVSLQSVSDAVGEERRLHERFAAKRLNGEWFALDEADLKAITSQG